MKDLNVLAINSFPIHGMAGLKTSLAILGQRVLPVPTVLLNGLTNMPFVKKYFPDFKELLEGTFRLIEHRNQKVILCIGYLGLPSHVDTILESIERYRNHIHSIYTDPICGDHGKMYVPIEIISRWPELIAVSNYIFPNVTELRLITGFSAEDGQHISMYAHHFKEKYPSTKLIVTSCKTEAGDVGVILFDEGHNFEYSHRYMQKNYGGTGDAFIAYFILFHIYKSLPVERAIQEACDKVLEKIFNSIEDGSDELRIEQILY